MKNCYQYKYVTREQYYEIRKSKGNGNKIVDMTNYKIVNDPSQFHLLDNYDEPYEI